MGYIVVEFIHSSSSEWLQCEKNIWFVDEFLKTFWVQLDSTHFENSHAFNYTRPRAISIENMRFHGQATVRLVCLPKWQWRGELSCQAFITTQLGE